MCHTVIAMRVCQVCHRTQGETAVDFTPCARKCSSPFYCVTPTPQMEICSVCAACTAGPGLIATTTSSTADSTPVMSRNSSVDANSNEAVSAAAAAATAIATTSAMPGVIRREMAIHRRYS